MKITYEQVMSILEETYAVYICADTVYEVLTTTEDSEEPFFLQICDPRSDGYIHEFRRQDNQEATITQWDALVLKDQHQQEVMMLCLQTVDLKESVSS